VIIFDTETTDLLMPEVADLASQPHIIEIAMIKLDSQNYREVDRYEALIKPPVPLDDEKHKSITGLTNAKLDTAATFLELYEEVRDFFLGERKWIAHNMQFDRGVLVAELRRIGQEYAFPYPPEQICTVDRTKHVKGRRLKLTELFELKMKKKFKQEHRAMSDVEALADIVRSMKL
jgi:DNA polymerase-3 subunit epsilon